MTSLSRSPCFVPPKGETAMRKPVPGGFPRSIPHRSGEDRSTRLHGNKAVPVRPKRRPSWSKRRLTYSSLSTAPMAPPPILGCERPAQNDQPAITGVPREKNTKEDPLVQTVANLAICPSPPRPFGRSLKNVSCLMQNENIYRTNGTKITTGKARNPERRSKI